MDSKAAENLPPRQLRRSSRHVQPASAQAVIYEPTPRGPLKRGKKPPKPQTDPPEVNGTNDHGSDDEESPQKKSRPQAGDGQGGGDAPPNEEFEPMEAQEQTEEPEDVKGSINYLKQQINSSVPAHLQDVNLKPRVVLGSRCSLIPETESVIKPKVEQPKKRDASPSKHITPNIPIKTTGETHRVTVISMADYKKKMEANIPEIPKVNHYVQSNYPIPMKTRRRTTDSSTQKTVVTEKTQGTKRMAASRQRAGDSSKGFLKYFWQLVLLMLLSAGFLFGFKHLPAPQRSKDNTAQSSRAVDSGLFVQEFTHLKLLFPSQREELWKRSKIHLQKHLDLLNPTEPVSMILTSGVRAQKTLLCLARSVASAFSSALNSSVVVMDGASKSNLDSDQVKMDIDSQLKAAFGGDKPAAVVHRFEELPPGSTLIFYRYCDHETAAFKRAFILFTVLLPDDDLSTEQTLKDVEEKVRDQVEERFVGTETAFNKMDADKFSGLWSRVAHLILPVVYEDEIEQKGC